MDQVLAWSGGQASIVDPMFLDWYKSKHEARFIRERGDGFEEYVGAVLRQFHTDFYNPAPKGRLGDGGSDGIAEGGDICYACYGSRAQGDSERALRDKVESDFRRALECWDSFTKWRFVTNSPTGPLVGEHLFKISKEHSDGTSRPLAIRIWGCDDLWIEVISRLDVDRLNYIFPGVPWMVDIELGDMIPLLDALGRGENVTGDTGGAVAPVPYGKVEFNGLPEPSRIEMNVGRRYAHRIRNWYQRSTDPTRYDRHATRFKGLYEEYRSCTDEPSAILERLYVALAGDNFRAQPRRAEAAYAVLAYFFDECHIFETPPADNDIGG